VNPDGPEVKVSAPAPESPGDGPARCFRATVQYDGTAYLGFQRQRRGPTIQAALENTLAEMTGHPVRVIGAGRTDTGVHALGQVVSFTIEWPDRHGPQALLKAMNAGLPPDIAVTDIAGAPPGFHPRFDARRRTYEYHILYHPVRQPLWRHRAWYIRREPDIDRMNAAAALLVGSQDFATFGRAPVGDNTVREVYEAAWRRSGERLVFRITANAFLNRMVRSLVGSLKEVGVGRWPVEEFAAALAACDRQRSATAAPAHGLYLMSVEYAF
jgi:tRNA pseudouridine38-40 synthase